MAIGNRGRSHSQSFAIAFYLVLGPPTVYRTIYTALKVTHTLGRAVLTYPFLQNNEGAHASRMLSKEELVCHVSVTAFVDVRILYIHVVDVTSFIFRSMECVQ